MPWFLISGIHPCSWKRTWRFWSAGFQGDLDAFFSLRKRSARPFFQLSVFKSSEMNYQFSLNTKLIPSYHLYVKKLGCSCANILRAKEVMIFFVEDQKNAYRKSWSVICLEKQQPVHWYFLGGVGNIWVFPKIGIPQNGWFIRENPITMDDLGIPTIFGNTHIFHCLPKLHLIWGELFFFSLQKGG